MKAHVNYLTLIIIVLAGSCRQPKALVYKTTKNFAVQKVGLKQTQLSMDVELYNPNNYRLKLKDADLDIFLNGNKLGKMSAEERISVPKLDTFSFPVTINVDLVNVFPNALQILFNKTLDIKLAGKLKAGRHGAFITVPVEFETKQDLRSIMGDIQN